MPERAPAGAGFVYLPVFGPGYGRWRLEMETAEPVKLDYFLNFRITFRKDTLDVPPVTRK
jgi:hypothetical protein